MKIGEIWRLKPECEKTLNQITKSLNKKGVCIIVKIIDLFSESVTFVDTEDNSFITTWSVKSFIQIYRKVYS